MSVHIILCYDFMLCLLFREPGVPGELSEPTIASVPVVHNIHELKVSIEVFIFMLVEMVSWQHSNKEHIKDSLY